MKSFCSCAFSYDPLLLVLLVCDILMREKWCLYNIIIGGKLMFGCMLCNYVLLKLHISIKKLDKYQFFWIDKIHSPCDH